MIIYTAKNRLSKKWKPIELSEEELSEKLSTFKITKETYSNYMSMTKDEQGKIKDVGGFVGGELIGTQRKKGAVKNRCLMTLDIDSGGPNIVDDINTIMDAMGFKGICYSTHKHSAAKPRLRVLLPFKPGELPNAAEYEFITRVFSEMIGMEAVDRTTWQPERLMYFPSRSIDGEKVFIEWEGDYIDKADYLHEGWQDRSKWPKHPLEEKEIKEYVNGAKQEDPWEKGGIIGAFCKAFPIPRLFNELVTGVYESVDDEGSRYTYIGSETSGGVVNYDDRWIYSHHHSDPIGGKLMNAFDIVRIILCEGEEKKALEYCSSISEVAAACIEDDYDDGFEEVMKDSKEKLPPGLSDKSYREKLEYIKKKAVGSYKNLCLILKYEFTIRYEAFADKIYFNCHNKWKKSYETLEDIDIMELHKYLERVFKMSVSQDKIISAVKTTANANRYDKVLDKFNSLPEWDGKSRLETLFIDYFGLEDTKYHRAVAVLFICATIKRAFYPGCKYDHMVVLVGPGGIGKSSFGRIMFDFSFSDSLTMEDFKSKTGCEKLIGFLLHEIPELAGGKKTDSETTKSFTSKQEDTYRPAYGRVTETRPRRCTFLGTTNNDKFLKDSTGNRRFLLVYLNRTCLDQEKLAANRDQILAEAMLLYEDAKMYLEGDVAKEAEKKQDKALDVEGYTSIIEEFIERKYPEDWKELSSDKKMEYLEGTKSSGTQYYMENGVTLADIWILCFRKNLLDKTRRDGNELVLSLKSLGFTDSGHRRDKQRIYKPRS